MKQAVALHYQTIPKDSEGLIQKISNSGRPIINSFVPVLFLKDAKAHDGTQIMPIVYPETNFYTPEAIQQFQKNLDNPNITKFQEGLFHYCQGCFNAYQKNGGRKNENAFPDPWHEIDYYCTFTPDDLEIKKRLIKNGRNLLEQLLGKINGYCNPQHYSSKKLVKAAQEANYPTLMIRNLTKLPVYKQAQMKILPCSKIGEKHYKTSPVVFAYFHHLVNNQTLRNEFLEILSEAEDFRDLPVSKKPLLKPLINQEILKMGKKSRDLEKIWNQRKTK